MPASDRRSLAVQGILLLVLAPALAAIGPAKADGASFTVSPSPVTFGVVALGESLEVKVTFTNDGTLPLVVTTWSVEGDAPTPRFSVSGSPEGAIVDPGVRLSSHVRFEPDAAGPVSARLRVEASIEGCEKDCVRSADVALEGEGYAVAAAFRLLPARLDFGRVEVGDRLTLDVEIHNDGPSVLRITQAAAESSAFSLTEVPDEVPLGGSASLRVVFEPGSAGATLSTLSVVGVATECQAPVCDAKETAELSGDGFTDPPVGRWEPGTLEFGETRVGVAGERDARLLNDGPRAFEIVSARIEPSGTGFSLLTSLPGANVASGSGLDAVVAFAPTAEGAQTATLLAVARDATCSPSACESEITATLTGKGTRPPAAGSFDPASLDWGAVEVGSSARRVATFTNAGSHSLRLDDGSLPEGPFSNVAAPTGAIEAGKSATLEFEFAPAGAGAASATFRATFTAVACEETPPPGEPDPCALSLELPLAGTGRALGLSARFDPSQLTFPATDRGLATDLTVRLLNEGTSTVRVTIGPPAEAAFALLGDVPETLAGESEATLTVRFQPAAIGAFGAELRATLATQECAPGDAACALDVALALSGEGRAPHAAARLDPASLDFGTVTLPSTSDLATRIVNEGRSPLTLLSVPSPPSPFSVAGAPDGAIAPGETAVLALRFAPGSAGGAEATVDVLLAPDACADGSPGSSCPIRIPLALSGRAQLPPLAAHVDPANLAWPGVEEGSSLARKARVHNDGGLPLVLLTTKLSGNAFQLAGLPSGTVAPGESREVTIVFAPRAAGAFEGTVEIVVGHESCNEASCRLTLPLQLSATASARPVAAPPPPPPPSDETPPVTTLVLGAPQLSPGLYAPPLRVTLASEDDSPDPVIRYRLDAGPLLNYTEPLRIVTAGEHTLAYFAVDAAGNNETERVARFRVFGPLSLQIEGPRNALVGEPLDAAVIASRPLARLFVSVDDGRERLADEPFVRATFDEPGVHVLRARAFDAQGFVAEAAHRVLVLPRSLPTTAELASIAPLPPGTWVVPVPAGTPALPLRVLLGVFGEAPTLRVGDVSVAVDAASESDLAGCAVPRALPGERLHVASLPPLVAGSEVVLDVRDGVVRVLGLLRCATLALDGALPGLAGDAPPPLPTPGPAMGALVALAAGGLLRRRRATGSDRRA